MTEEVQGRRRWRSKLWIVALVLTILIFAIVIPPLVSINRYKSRIAQAMSNSLGRPVRLSGVELRLLPRPEFVITDLTVDEDPSYGAEPVLHANSVTAAIRFFSLWRGRLEISRISVDEASLNLVRTTEGRWNLDTLFRTAAHQQADGEKQGRLVPLPYLEATNSRINIKQGFEKLPYSLGERRSFVLGGRPRRLARAAEGAARAHRRESRPGRHGNCAAGRADASRRGVAPDAGARGDGVARGADGAIKPVC